MKDGDKKSGQADQGGESAGRRRGLEEGGGQPLTTPLEDGQNRGVDDEGRHTTGTHGGPHKDGRDGTSKENRDRR